VYPQKWEYACGLDNSFGYNQNSLAASFMSPIELVATLVDVVSKNGNFLVGVGPRADGSIPNEQLGSLGGLIEWLDVNHESIFDTTPFTVAIAVAFNDAAAFANVRFTRTSGALYAHVLDPTPFGANLAFHFLKFPEGATIAVTEGTQPVTAAVSAEGTFLLSVPPAPPSLLAYMTRVFRITPVPEWVGPLPEVTWPEP
jgi:alpha-L-fucosidase